MRTLKDVSSSFSKLHNRSVNAFRRSNSQLLTALASSVRSGPDSRPWAAMVTKTRYRAYMAFERRAGSSVPSARSKRSARGFREAPFETAAVSCFSSSWIARTESSASRAFRFLEDGGREGGIGMRARRGELWKARAA